SLRDNDPLLLQERQTLDNDQPQFVCIKGPGSEVCVFDGGRWKQRDPDLANLDIFDQTFVERNVCTGSVVEHHHRQTYHELVLGETGVQLSAELDELESKIKEVGGEL